MLRLCSAKEVCTMDCVDRIELKNYLRGNCPPERMLAIDQHLSECEECRRLVEHAPVVAGFASVITGAEDCPEYEELSAYVEGALDSVKTKTIRAHANLCELCARDVQRIRELRSHAALRGKVIVKPAMSRRPRSGVFVYWRQALAAASLCGLVAAVLFFGNLTDKTGRQNPQIAHNPPIIADSPQFPAVDNTKPEQLNTVAAEPSPVSTPVKAAAAPVKPAQTPKTVLRDGRYAVIRSNDKLRLAKNDGSALSVGSQIAAIIDKKLRTGKIENKPVQMAMATIHLRSGEGYVAPPSAPKAIAPVDKLMLTQKPTFNWSEVELAEQYRIRIFDRAGNLVVEQVVNDNVFSPSNALQRGKAYSWRVGVRFSETDSWTESAASGFAIVSTEDYSIISRARRDFPSSHIVLGAAYESAGLFEEAAAEYKALLRANPGSELADKLLKGVAGR